MKELPCALRCLSSLPKSPDVLESTIQDSKAGRRGCNYEVKGGIYTNNNCRQSARNLNKIRIRLLSYGL